MNAGTRKRLISIMLGIVLVLGIGANSGVESTSAAWTDQTSVAVTASSGTWVTTSNSCVAYDLLGLRMRGTCTVTGITFDQWGTGDTRNYYVSFSAPFGAVRVSFTVDLRTAAGEQSTPWAWQQAGVLPNGHFTPDAGWTCQQLPVVTGISNRWQTQTMYFQAVNDRTTRTTICS